MFELVLDELPICGCLNLAGNVSYKGLLTNTQASCESSSQPAKMTKNTKS